MGRLSKSHIVLYLGIALTGLVVACNKTPHENVGGASNPSPSANNNQIQGGVDGGGGSYVGTEAEQIKAIFHGDNGFNLKETVKDAFKNIEAQVTQKYVDHDIENIFSRMLGPGFSGDQFEIYKDIDGSAYELKPEGSCLEDGGFKDASTMIDKKESAICFSLEGLKKLPIQAIPFQLVALAIHEHAHHYGFSEVDAVKAQKQALQNMNYGLLSGFFLKTISVAGSVRDDTRVLIESMSPSFSDKLLCKHLSTIDTTAARLIELSYKIDNEFELRMLVTALDYQFSLTKKSLTGVEDLKKLTKGMLDFCGNDPLEDAIWVERVHEGDRKQLKASLIRARELANQIVNQAASASKQRKN